MDFQMSTEISFDIVHHMQFSISSACVIMDFSGVKDIIEYAQSSNKYD